MKNVIRAMRFSEELYKQVINEAKKQDRTFANMVRVMVKFYFKNR